ncbi:MAG TPA: D-alanine--D-alanine ligase [Thermoanaerobaculia bacterium]|jgi:D-alanine-D-alanine ligase
MDKRKRVAVLFGGRSVEHEISIITGLQLINALDAERFEPLAVYVAHNGRWYVGDALLDRKFYKGLPGALEALQQVALLPVPGLGGLLPVSKSGVIRMDDRIPVDVFFPAFHGSYGEDGCVQGLLELAGVTYTGSGVLASAVGMDKFVAKSIASSGGIPVLPGCLVRRDELDGGLAAVRRRILETPGLGSFPLFVKPCSSGSSVGISRAGSEGELDAALLRVFDVDLLALVEPCVVDPLEINVSVLDGRVIRASVVEIPLAEGGGLLTYEQKYMRRGGTKGGTLAEGMAGASRVIDPADLPAELKSRATAYAIDVFRLLRCSGVARVDFLCDARKDAIYFNEINTLPGSLAYYLWAKTRPRLLYTELLNEIIEQAERQSGQRAQLRRDFGFKSLSASG